MRCLIGLRTALLGHGQHQDPESARPLSPATSCKLVLFWKCPVLNSLRNSFIRFNKNSSVQDSDFGLGQRNVPSFYPHLSCCVHKTGPMLLNVELTVPLTNETRHLFWIWCHGYPQAGIPGEGASPRTVLRWQYWFNLLIRSLGLTGRKTQPKLLNYLSHAALLTLYSSTDGNSSQYWHLLWIKILKKMSDVSPRYLDQTGQNACLLTTPPAALADLPFKLQIPFNTKCHRKVQTQVDASHIHFSVPCLFPFQHEC